MNKTYQLVWNTLQQSWVVTSELGKARKKSKTAGVIAALLGGFMLMAPVYAADPADKALPVLGSITSGNATTALTSGNLVVNQLTDKLIANWSNFDVGKLSKVTFNQPSSNSVVLNRITSIAPTQILGRVVSNGQIIMVNPNGFTFGPGAQLNASSVIASVLGITDANFLKGTLQFDRGNATGSITNRGSILATAGDAFMLAPSVLNYGSIRARDGNLNIVNGNRISVNNVLGTAKLDQVSGVAGLIQNTGILRADKISTDTGKILLLGDRARTGSILDLAGQLISNSNDIKGKTINLDNLVVAANTNINASDNIHVRGVVDVLGNNKLFSLTHNTALRDGLDFRNAAKINLLGTNIHYRVNTDSYNVIKTIQDLQNIMKDPSKLTNNYVFGVDIDGAGATLLPVGSLTGLFNGLGHGLTDIAVPGNLLGNLSNLGDLNAVLGNISTLPNISSLDLSNLLGLLNTGALGSLPAGTGDLTGTIGGLTGVLSGTGGLGGLGGILGGVTGGTGGLGGVLGGVTGGTGGVGGVISGVTSGTGLNIGLLNGL